MVAYSQNAVAAFAEAAQAKTADKPIAKVAPAPATKVTLKGDMERGTLQIEYFSRTDLDRLYQLMIHNE